MLEELVNAEVMVAFPVAAALIAGPVIAAAANKFFNKPSRLEKEALQVQGRLGSAEAEEVLRRIDISKRIEGLAGGPSAFSAEAPFQLGRTLGDESNVGEALGRVDFSRFNKREDLFRLIGALPTSAPAASQNALLANQNANLRAGAIGELSSGITSSLLSSGNLRDILGGLRSSREAGGSISTGPSGLNVTSDFFRD